jgi:hypothetical protein
MHVALKPGGYRVKIIEAMKRVKSNKEKVADLQKQIGQYCANLNFETPPYGSETTSKIREWLQSCDDTSLENARLLVAIQRTNLATMVTITLGGNAVTKSIAEWVWRRREYAALDLKTWLMLTDRSLREGTTQSSTGGTVEVKIVRHFDPVQRDKMVAMFKSEPHEIDAALEVVNAVTDLALV